MKVAIVHDWLTGMRGGERCLEVFCELFPDADLYSLLHVPGSVSPIIEKHAIHTSFIQHLPFSRSHYRYYLPLFPSAIESSFDLKGYELVISSSHCVAKGVRIRKGTCHLAYIYTPMRYIWDQYDTYFAKRQAGWLKRVTMSLIRPHLQRWDVSSNDRVHFFVAISQHVARRIQNYYGRKATVIYPPLNWQSFQASDRDDGFYLMVTAFAPYKRVDLAIEAANRLKFRLKIVGSGQDEDQLKRMAGPTVEFLGWQPDPAVRGYYACCKSLIFPGEEDFGIVPLEAMACGKPVIAYGKGGVLETVMPLNGSSTPLSRDPVTTSTPTGVFFYEQTVQALTEAIHVFERNQDRFDPQVIRAQVAPFDRTYFKENMRAFIDESYTQFHLTHVC